MTKRSNIEIIPEKIHLKSVRVISGSISSTPEADTSSIAHFGTSFELLQGVDISSKLIKIVFSVKFNALNDKNEPLGIHGEYSTEFIFLIENFNDYIVNQDTKNISLDAVLGTTLTGIVYSTTRGIVLTRTQGTVLDGVILPVINPAHLLSQQE